MGVNPICFCTSNIAYLVVIQAMKFVTGILYTKNCTGSYCPDSLLLVWSVGQILVWISVLVAFAQKACARSKRLVVVLLFPIITTIIVSFLGLINTVPELEVKTCNSNGTQIALAQSPKLSCDINPLHYVAITIFGLDVLHVIIASLIIMTCRNRLFELKNENLDKQNLL